MTDLLNTAALVIRAKQGDRDAYGRLAEHFRPSLYALCLVRMRNPDDAQELVQDVLVHAFVKLSQLREPAAFPGWLRRIAVRMAINRRTRRGPVPVTHAQCIESVPARGEQPVDNLISRESAAAVRAGLERLAPMDRDTLVAFYFRGQSLDQISRQSDAPIGTVKRRLHVARHRLRREMKIKGTHAQKRKRLTGELVGAGT